MNCETAKQFLLLLNYTELSLEEEDALEQHLSTCAECQAERVRLEKFEDVLAHGEPDMPAGLLARCRRDLVEKIEQEKRPASRFSPGRLWRDWIVHTPMWLRPIGAVAMLAVGFLGARMIPQTPALDRLATVAGVAEQPPAFTRVRLVNPADESGRVKVMYEETRQRELSGFLTDENIRQLLVSASADPADPGLRIESTELLKNQCSYDNVKSALLDRLRSDPNSGVRLKALEALKPYAKEPQVRSVLAQVLLNDDNPGVRTQAIDLLVQSKHSEPEMVGVFQELLRNEQNSYIRSRSQRALSDMKASVGTF